MDIVDDICAFAWQYQHIVVQPHQRRWLDHIVNGGPRVLLLAPRGHGKTTTLIKVLLVYLICHDPDIKILIASHKEAVAKRQARMIQMALERPEIDRDFHISKGKPWKREEFYIRVDEVDKDEPVVFAVAGLGGMTGFRFNWIVFDDLLVKENQKTEKMRLQLTEWIEDEVLKARDPGPKQKVVVIGTRKHYQDWYKQLMNSSQFKVLVDRAEQEDGSVLWPYELDHDGNVLAPMFTHEELESRKITETPRSFAQEYQNDPSPPQGMYLKREWLKWYDDLPPEHCLRKYMGIDPSAGSELERASSLAVAVIAEDVRTQQIYVLELFKDKMPLGEQFTKIQELYDKWRPVSSNIEAVLINKDFAKRIIDRIPNAYPIDYIHTRLRGTGEVNKELRIKNYIGLYLEEGRVMFRDPSYDYQTREFIETEYIAFPAEDGETDLLDALTLAVDLVDVIPRMDQPPMFAWS